ncbi:hypothetical protein HK096_004754, partial [Nowakowskiella sp. JEL0078]
MYTNRAYMYILGNLYNSFDPVSISLYPIYLTSLKWSIVILPTIIIGIPMCMFQQNKIDEDGNLILLDIITWFQLAILISAEILRIFILLGNGLGLSFNSNGSVRQYSFIAVFAIISLSFISLMFFAIFIVSPNTRKRFPRSKAHDTSTLNHIELIQAPRKLENNFDDSDIDFTIISDNEPRSPRRSWSDGPAESPIIELYELTGRISFDVVKEFEKVKIGMDGNDSRVAASRESKKSGLSREIDANPTLRGELTTLLDSEISSTNPEDINPPELLLESNKQNISPTRSNDTNLSSHSSSLPINIELFKKIDQSVLAPSFLLDDNSDTDTQTESSDTETDNDIETEPEEKLNKPLQIKPKALNSFYIRDMSPVSSLNRPPLSSPTSGLNKKRSHIGNLSLESTFSPPRLSMRSNSYPQLTPVKGILTTGSREMLRMNVFGGGFAGKTPELVGPKREKKSVRFELPSPESSGLEDEDEFEGEEFMRSVDDVESDDDNVPKFKEIMFVPEAM